MALKTKAKAIVATRRRRKASEEAQELLATKVASRVRVPTPEAGRDAPELSEIVDNIIPLLPTPKVEQVTNTIVQKIDEGDLSGMVQAMLDAKVPEIERSLRPKVELIREDVSEEKLEGFVSKKELDEKLRLIQNAITYHSGGGRPPDTTSLANVIEADEATNVITVADLDITKLNIVHATVASSTIQLPAISPNYIVWVEDAVEGGGNITITREA